MRSGGGDMPARKPDPIKLCRFCGVQFFRKFTSLRNGKPRLDDLSSFYKRKFCSHECGARSRFKRVAFCAACSSMTVPNMIKDCAACQAVQKKLHRAQRVAWYYSNLPRVKKYSRDRYDKNFVPMDPVRRRKNREAYLKHREKRLVQHKAYRDRIENKIRLREVRRAWYERNKSTLVVAARLRRREKHKLAAREHYLLNRKKYLAIAAKKRKTMAYKRRMATYLKRNSARVNFRRKLNYYKRTYGEFSNVRMSLLKVQRTLKTIKKGDKNEGTRRRVNRPSKRKDATRSAGSSAEAGRSA